jgi:hypothetical protein
LIVSLDERDLRLNQESFGVRIWEVNPNKAHNNDGRKEARDPNM